MLYLETEARSVLQLGGMPPGRTTLLPERFPPTSSLLHGVYVAWFAFVREELLYNG